MRRRAYRARWLGLLCCSPFKPDAVGSVCATDLTAKMQALRPPPGTSRSANTPKRPSIAAITSRPGSNFLQLTTQVPTSAEAQQRLGMVLQLEHRFPEAEACFRAALHRDPDYVDALIGLGQVEALRGDVTAALKHFETAIEIDPHRPKAHSCLGRLLESQGKTDEALAEYFRTLNLSRTTPR